MPLLPSLIPAPFNLSCRASGYWRATGTVALRERIAGGPDAAVTVPSPGDSRESCQLIPTHTGIASRESESEYRVAVTVTAGPGVTGEWDQANESYPAVRLAR